MAMTPQRILIWTSAALLWSVTHGSVLAADPRLIPRIPKGSIAEPMIEMPELKANSEVASPAADVVVFDGPLGEGRVGAKGIIFQAPPGLDRNTWVFRYTRSAGSFPLQIMHHYRGGQTIAYLDKDGIGISSPRKWTDVGYNSGDRSKIEKTDAYDSVFPLKDNVEYQVVSRCGGRGHYEIWIDGKPVAFTDIDDYGLLSFDLPDGKKFPKSGQGPLAFKGANMPMQMEKSWTGLFLGPVDTGINICREIRFYAEFVDPNGKVVESLSKNQLLGKVTSTPAPPTGGKPTPEAPLNPKPVTTPNPPPATSSNPSATPVSPLSASDLVRANRTNLVFVTMQNAAGSGFIANYGNGTYLITNAHVAAGAKGAVFKTLDGHQLQVGAPAVAVGHDIFLMAINQTGKPLQVMTGVDENASINDEVVVLGNAEGAGVINTITGRIVGLGPNLVEVDAPFQPGNSGSPIIHVKTGKVIGVATYETIRKYDPSTKEAVKTPVVRRFGYRIDSVKTWEPVNWQSFNAQAAEVENVDALTKDLVALLQELGKDGRVTRGRHLNPVIKTRIDQWLDAKAKRLSPHDATMADLSFLSFLKITCQSDVTAAQQHITYDYFRHELEDQQRERTEIANSFSKIIDSLQGR
jgi:S1-C subfamily serine protease